MRSRILPVAGLSAAALIAAAAVAPMATASSPLGSSKTPATVSSGHNAGSQIIAKKGKCKTAMGTFANNGIISWESPANGFDAAGAADFTCGKKKKGRTFSTITLVG